jgi:hypothetical protein
MTRLGVWIVPRAQMRRRRSLAARSRCSSRRTSSRACGRCRPTSSRGSVTRRGSAFMGIAGRSALRRTQPHVRRMAIRCATSRASCMPPHSVRAHGPSNRWAALPAAVHPRTRALPSVCSLRVLLCVLPPCAFFLHVLPPCAPSRVLPPCTPSLYSLRVLLLVLSAPLVRSPLAPAPPRDRVQIGR